MKTILTCSEMKECDRYTIQDLGIPSCVLMERAALACAEEVQKRSNGKIPVLAVCGSGNNGGDGIAAARILFSRGYPARILFAGNKEHMTPETARQMQIAKNTGVPILWFERPDGRILDELSQNPVILDAIFGIGLSRPVEGPLAELIRLMNESSGLKIAVDVPSGICGDTGAVLGTAFKADCTVTFAYLKRGLCLYPGRMYSGETITAEIGVRLHQGFHTDENQEHVQTVESMDFRFLRNRDPGGNKGTFGRVLVLAGSAEICGAAFFAAAAALKCGAGMVMIHTAPENRVPLQMLLPEALISCSDSEEERQRIYAWSDVVAAGPGIGTGNIAKENILWFLKKCHEDGKPLVLDADGLNLLAANPAWKAYLGETTVLTPHLGEMSRLTGIPVPDLKKDLVSAAYTYSTDTHSVMVLKDAATVVTYPDGRGFINNTGNDGLATAGSGDILTGIIAAFLLKSQGGPERAVCFHGICGDLAAEKLGRASVTAGAVIDSIPEAFLRMDQEGAC